MNGNLYAYVLNNPINNSDPSGLWTGSEHANLTVWANNSLGSDCFDSNDIGNIINSNVGSDNWKTFFSGSQHYSPGNQTGSENFFNSSLERAVDFKLNNKNDEAMKALGEGLHSIQDYYSHYANDFSIIEHGPSYVADYLGLDKYITNYDNPSQNRSNEVNALIDSKEYLRRYNKMLKERMCKK